MASVFTTDSSSLETITTPSSSSHESTMATLDWPEASPIQDSDESIDVEVLDDAIVSASSTSSVIGTPPTNSYVTPKKLKAPPRPPRVPGTILAMQESSHYDVAALLQQSWRKAIRVLRVNPSLMTRTILCLALKQRPPVYVVDWMIRLNPEAVSVPPSEKGPSPLFVAVQEGCSTAVVETVLKACPKALVARPSGSQWDPVALAKRERANEKDLLALLHRPVSYWLDRQNEPESPLVERNWPRIGANKRKTTVIPEVFVNKELDQVRQKLVMSPRASPRLGIAKRETVTSTIVTPETKPPPRPIPPLLHRTRPLGTPTQSKPERSIISQVSSPASSAQSSSLTAAERQELENVKFLCLALLKAHRRLIETHQVQQQQPQGAESTTKAMHLDESERRALLQAMEQRQEEQNRICLIALDMKEKSIRALAKRLEQRLSPSSLSCHTATNKDTTDESSSQALSAQLRSSYVHLYRRFLGLEQELQSLKQAARTVSSLSDTDASSCQAVFDPPPEHCRATFPTTKYDCQGKGCLDDIQSLFSDADNDLADGECSKSCLRWPLLRLRPLSS